MHIKIMETIHGRGPEEPALPCSDVNVTVMIKFKFKSQARGDICVGAAQVAAQGAAQFKIHNLVHPW